MFITPMDPLKAIDNGFANSGARANKNPTSGVPFQEIFQNAIADVKDTQAAVDANSQLLATGQIDDLHTLGIDATKAYLAERLVVELRNRAMDAYSEIMRINV